MLWLLSLLRMRRYVSRRNKGKLHWTHLNLIYVIYSIRLLLGIRNIVNIIPWSLWWKLRNWRLLKVWSKLMNRLGKYWLRRPLLIILIWLILCRLSRGQILIFLWLLNWLLLLLLSFYVFCVIFLYKFEVCLLVHLLSLRRSLCHCFRLRRANSKICIYLFRNKLLSRIYLGLLYRRMRLY